MQTTLNTAAELMLELALDDRTRKIFRLVDADGTMAYVEISDLIDFSRPANEGPESYPLYPSLLAAWQATTRFLSADGLLTRTVWHEDLNEWANLIPVFVHPELLETVYADLAALVNSLSLAQIARCRNLPLWMAAVTNGRVAVDEIEMAQAA